MTILFAAGYMYFALDVFSYILVWIPYKIEFLISPLKPRTYFNPNTSFKGFGYLLSFEDIFYKSIVIMNLIQI